MTDGQQRARPEMRGMYGVVHPQGRATISTGGAAKWVGVGCAPRPMFRPARGSMTHRTPLVGAAFIRA